MITWPFEPHSHELGMAQSLQVVDWDNLNSINLFKSSCKYYLVSFLRNIELTDLKCIDLNMYYIMFFRWWNHLLCKVYLTLRNGSVETFFLIKNFQTKKKIFNQCGYSCHLAVKLVLFSPCKKTKENMKPRTWPKLKIWISQTNSGNASAPLTPDFIAKD